MVILILSNYCSIIVELNSPVPSVLILPCTPWLTNQNPKSFIQNPVKMFLVKTPTTAESSISLLLIALIVILTLSKYFYIIVELSSPCLLAFPSMTFVVKLTIPKHFILKLPYICTPKTINYVFHKFHLFQHLCLRHYFSKSDGIRL